MPKRQEQIPAAAQKPSALILPTSYMVDTPPESFPDPHHGEISWHTLFSAPKTNTSDLSVGIAICPPHTGHLGAHRHKQAEIYHILEGEGEITIDGVSSRVSSGSTVFIPGDAEHGIVNRGEERLRWLYVFAEGSFEDVVYRFSGDWDQANVGVSDGNVREKAKL
ncbi:Cupin 2 conserved barrel [Penicillium macrosclerotiorum]|uniref:Cupin 2 conserved barrel n=1 Tax=Penicillium macrosclerotiorum TaxID=303699 RepID=UPI0025477E03|nr:Cupin 2 conserved barrel [Penicillium macrosclerotiorum]KAJ5669294.1 Cupin 2 conserved barrel [Penicillium macrosclerotiorum]